MECLYHEHLTDRCSLLCACQRYSCQQMVHGVFALMNICQTLFSLLCAFVTAPVIKSADGVHGVFVLMNICQTAVLFALRLLRQSCQQMVHGVFAS
jgi:hypothetical protein